MLFSSCNIVQLWLQVKVVTVDGVRTWLWSYTLVPQFEVVFPHLNVQFMRLIRMWPWSRPSAIKEIFIFFYQKSVVELSFNFVATPIIIGDGGRERCGDGPRLLLNYFLLIVLALVVCISLHALASVSHYLPKDVIVFI